MRTNTYSFKSRAVNLGFTLFLAFALVGGLASVAHCQAATPPTQIVKKFIGDTTTFAWEFDVADEATITHFSVKWVDDLTKTFIELKQVPKNLRGTSISAAFTAGFKFTYYAVTAVDARVPAVVVESSPSNTVATERLGKPPRNLTEQ
jgi:hypothetical protein